MILDDGQEQFIQSAFNKERYASAAYLALHGAALRKGTFKAAEYFKIASLEEADHALLVVDFANKYNIKLEVESLLAFDTTFVETLDPAEFLKVLANNIYEMEKALFSFYSLRTDDRLLMPFALKMFEIQLDAIDETNDLIQELTSTEDGKLRDNIYGEYIK